MRITKILALAIILTSMISCGNQPKGVKTLENKIDSVSYAVGLNISTQMRANFEEMNEAAFLQAFRDGLDSANFKMDPKLTQQIIQPYFRKKQEEKRLKDAEAKFAGNRKAGEDFLAANKSKEGIITTGSGLQYKVLKEGNGAQVKPSDRVRINYHGTTIDGTVFDSTIEKKKPYESSATQFITGFNEALALMKVGSKYKVFIPQELAYGVRSRGPKIQPFSALIFEIEILDIITPKK